jgi:hypothetical protein
LQKYDLDEEVYTYNGSVHVEPEFIQLSSIKLFKNHALYDKILIELKNAIIIE